MDAWIESVMAEYGWFGVAVLMLVENIFPPIPSEVVMPWAGYAVSRGRMSFPTAIMAGAVGSYLGALFWYVLARWVGKERLIVWLENKGWQGGWWLTLSRKEVDQVDRWFDRWGARGVLLCRLIPGIRTLISVPAGFARMPLGSFSLFTILGSGLWSSLLAAIGWWLGSNYGSLAEPLGWISAGVIAVLFAMWLYRITNSSFVGE